jgi:solute:Na+ symporter, SSS family
MSYIYFYLIIYIFFLFLITYLVSKKQTSEDFLISGRNRSSLQIFASKFAATVGVAWFITYTGFAYEYGISVFILLAGTTTGYILFAFWAAPKIQKNSKEKKFYTIGDFVLDKTKSNTNFYFSNILSSIIQFSWLLVGIIGGAKIIADFGFISYPFAVIITSSVILIYLLLAGFKAVIITDAIQSVIIFLLLILITFFITSSHPISSLLQFENQKADLVVILGFFLFGFLAVFSSSDRYQLCYAAKNIKKLKKGIGFAIVPLLISAFSLLLIGTFMAINSPGLDSGLVFTEAMKNFLPDFLLPIGIVLFFAGLMSSVDTGVYAIASHYALSKKVKSIKSVRVATISLMLITTLFALLFSDIIDISIIAATVSLTLSFPIIYILFNGKNPKKFNTSILTSIIGLLLGLYLFGINPPIVLPTVIFGALGLLKK